MSDLAERYRLSQLVKQQENGAKKKKLRSLARVNNWVVNGEITAKEANAIYYSANLILKALELENR